MKKSGLLAICSLLASPLTLADDAEYARTLSIESETVAYFRYDFGSARREDNISALGLQMDYKHPFVNSANEPVLRMEWAGQQPLLQMHGLDLLKTEYRLNAAGTLAAYTVIDWAIVGVAAAGVTAVGVSATQADDPIVDTTATEEEDAGDDGGLGGIGGGDGGIGGGDGGIGGGDGGIGGGIGL